MDAVLSSYLKYLDAIFSIIILVGILVSARQAAPTIVGARCTALPTGRHTTVSERNHISVGCGSERSASRPRMSAKCEEASACSEDRSPSLMRGHASRRKIRIDSELGNFRARTLRAVCRCTLRCFASQGPHFVGRRMLARSVATTIFPVKPEVDVVRGGASVSLPASPPITTLPAGVSTR
jgi:hypothetical protein